MKKTLIGIGGGLLVFGIVIAFSLTSRKEIQPVRGGQEINLPEQTNAAVADKETLEVLPNAEPIQARDLLKEKMLKATDPNELKAIQKQIEELNMDILFSPEIDECSLVYEVQPKDVLSRIAKKHETTVNLIKRANNLESDIIIPGQKLKVNKCSFSIVVDKSQNVLTLVQNGEAVKKYIVSTGADSSTPIGDFVIINKLENPTWYKTGAVIPPDSPDNILGTRWMGFDLKGFGIHGTTEPDKLGQQITLGCVRMKNEDVEEIYDIIPVGTEVIIVD
ncbi:MAG: L,D-transpeptidase family protein [Candidatus Omnitrophica bacterium]|nr:L,D-transpeptidase family protein [Candidatus Omnitrophota bacterium]